MRDNAEAAAEPDGITKLMVRDRKASKCRRRIWSGERTLERISVLDVSGAAMRSNGSTTRARVDTRNNQSRSMTGDILVRLHSLIVESELANRLKVRFAIMRVRAQGSFQFLVGRSRSGVC